MGGKVGNLYHDPAKTPSKEEKRLMFALLLEKMILVVMGPHVYSFNGETRLQLEDGPLGLKLIGALAKVCMLNWTRTFLAMATLTTALSSTGDQRTAKVILEIANSVSELLPSNHE